MTTTVKFDCTWTGYVGAAFLGEPDVSVTADVHSDGEVHVTGVAIKDRQGNVELGASHDAFSIALFSKIKADFEADKAFLEEARDKASDDVGDFYMSGGRKRCPDQWRDEQLNRQYV